MDGNNLSKQPASGSPSLSNNLTPQVKHSGRWAIAIIAASCLVARWVPHRLYR